jgi:hypothetical protein
MQPAEDVCELSIPTEVMELRLHTFKRTIETKPKV